MLKKPAYLSKIESLMTMSFYTLNLISTLWMDPLKVYKFLTNNILSTKTNQKQRSKSFESSYFRWASNRQSLTCLAYQFNWGDCQGKLNVVDKFLCQYWVESEDIPTYAANIFCTPTNSHQKCYQFGNEFSLINLRVHLSKWPSYKLLK